MVKLSPEHVGEEREPAGEHALRADARRNRDEIRRAALEVFGRRGLTAPMSDVARAAGVSKGTIYHRFGSRQGLIDAVVEELVSARIDEIIAAVEGISDPGVRLEEYLRRTLLLQFDEPAANDVITRQEPGSAPLTELCDRAHEVGVRLLADAQRAGAIRRDMVPGDMYQIMWERGVVLRVGPAQSRRDYERRTDYIIRGLRAEAG